MSSRRNLASLQDRLAAASAHQPTQLPPEPPALAVVPAAAPRAPKPELVQQSFALRPELRQALHLLAAQSGYNVQQFVLLALRAKGLDVQDSDLIDRRKVRG